MRATVKGTVLRAVKGQTSKGTEYHDVTLLQGEPGSGDIPELLTVRCWNGQVEKLAVGKPGAIEVVVRLDAGRTIPANGKYPARTFPSRLTVDAF